MIRIVLLDLMDTLVVDPYRAAVRAATGLELDEARPHRDPGAWPAFEVGALDEAAFFARFWGDGVDWSVDVAAFHRARRAGYRWVPGAREILDGLEGRVERHVASNYPVWIEELRARFRLDHRTEGVWSSHRLGVRKPEPAFFHRVLDGVGAEPGETLFVDDRAANCDAARAVGMRAHLFVDAADLGERLRAEAVLP